MSIKAKEWPEEKGKDPAWIGFDTTENKEIWVTDSEGEAGKWLILGWDVGYLPNGVVDPSAVKWLGTGEPENV